MVNRFATLSYVVHRKRPGAGYVGSYSDRMNTLGASVMTHTAPSVTAPAKQKLVDKHN